jgi:hypothetical protein
MKILDWTSFAIGVLLTTTIALGTGASNKIDKDLLKLDIVSWDAKTSSGNSKPPMGKIYQRIGTICLR